jgi:hypothetical protein
MPFYRTKGLIYNVWFMSVPTSYFETKIILQGSCTTCIVRLRSLKEHYDMLALRWVRLACTVVEVVQIPIQASVHVPDLNLEAGCCVGDGLHRLT